MRRADAGDRRVRVALRDGPAGTLPRAHTVLISPARIFHPPAQDDPWSRSRVSRPSRPSRRGRPRVVARRETRCSPGDVVHPGSPLRWVDSRCHRRGRMGGAWSGRVWRAQTQRPRQRRPGSSVSSSLPPRRCAVKYRPGICGTDGRGRRSAGDFWEFATPDNADVDDGLLVRARSKVAPCEKCRVTTSLPAHDTYISWGARPQTSHFVAR